MRHRLVRAGVIAALAGVAVVACGDDKVAAPQTVVWFGLNTAAGLRCSSVNNYQLPMGAQATITGGTGVGDRIKDGGENLVECDVRAVAGNASNFTVSLRFSGGEVGNFVADGTVSSSGEGELDVIFTTGAFSLGQDGCTASVDTTSLKPGAIWIKSLRCPDLRDPSSPGIACDGRGGVIFENCGH